MKAAAYLRVSTEEQATRNSVETQRTAVRQYAAREGIELTREYTDEGVSGALPLAERPAGAKLLKDAGAYDCILVYALDRLGRDTMVTLSAMAALRKSGADLISISENLQDDLLTEITAAIGSAERRAIRRRTQAGIVRVAHAGGWLGGCTPYGYRIEGKAGSYSLRPCEAEVVPGFTEAELVRRMYAMAAAGKSCPQIADWLNALGTTPGMRPQDGSMRGVRTERLAARWTGIRVIKVLSATIYKGVHTFKHRTGAIERTFPALVAPAVWQAAQQTMQGNKRAGNGNAKRENLLKGLIRCQDCGVYYVGMAFTDGQGKPRAYYKAPAGRERTVRATKPTTRCRHRPSVVAETIEAAVWADVQAVLNNPGTLLEELQEHLGGSIETRQALQDEIREYERRIKDKEGERAALVKAYAKGLLDDAELEQATAAYRAERAALDSYLADLEARIVSEEEAANRGRSVESLVKRYRENLEAAGLDRRAIVRELVETDRG